MILVKSKIYIFIYLILIAITWKNLLSTGKKLGAMVLRKEGK